MSAIIERITSSVRTFVPSVVAVFFSSERAGATSLS